MRVRSSAGVLEADPAVAVKALVGVHEDEVVAVTVSDRSTAGTAAAAYAGGPRCSPCNDAQKPSLSPSEPGVAGADEVPWLLNGPGVDEFGGGVTVVGCGVVVAEKGV